MICVSLGVLWFASDDAKEAPPVEPSPKEEPGKVDVPISEPNPLPPLVNTRDGRIIEVRGAEGPVSLWLGGPGVDADFQAESPNGLFPLPLTYEDEEIPTLEVRASAGERCFWGPLEADAKTLEVVAGAPLSLLVRNEFGQRLDAQVRIGLEFVGFVFLKEETSTDGLAVPCLPEGEYALSVTAPGYLASHLEILHSAEVRSVEVVLKEGSSIEGEVLAETGEPIEGAVVLVDACTDGVCVPHELVETSANGRFISDHLPSPEARLVARHPDFEARRATGRGNVRLVLKRGTPRTFVAVGSGEEPVEEARVVWKSDFDSGGGVTDSKGEWRDNTAPASARARAIMGRFESPWTSVSGSRVELDLSAASGGNELVRVVSAHRVHEVVFSQGETICAHDVLKPGDYRVYCSAGPTNADLKMAAGLARVHFELGRDASISPPPPKEHVFRIRSAEKPNLQIEFDGMTTQIEVMKDGENWLARASLWNDVEAPKWRASALGLGQEEGRATGESTSVELSKQFTRQVFVLDSTGSPINGAFIGIRSREGQMDWGKSSGDLPFQRRMAEGEALALYLVDARRGEAIFELSEGASDRVELRADVLSSTPTGYLSRAEIEALGFRLVRDGRGWRIDEFPPDSGVKRGDWWIAAWRRGNSVLVVTWNGGKYKEHVIRPQ